MKDSVNVDGAELLYSRPSTGPSTRPCCLWPTSVGRGPYERLTPPELAEALSIVYVELRASGSSGGAAGELTFDRVAADLDAVRRHLELERVAVLGHSLLGVLAIEYARRFPQTVSHVITVGTPPIGDAARVEEAADLDAVRRHLELERVAVLGHSLLGVLAIEYARRFPQTVSHVITVGTPPIGDAARVEEAARRFFEADASEERKRRLLENLARLPGTPSLRQAMFAQVPRQFYDSGFDPAPYFEDARARPEFFARLFGPLTAGWSAAEVLRELAVPTLLACGRYDYTVPHTLWGELAPDLPRATVRLFAESGHYPFFEEAGRFAVEIADWMDGSSGVA